MVQYQVMLSLTLQLQRFFRYTFLNYGHIWCQHGYLQMKWLRRILYRIRAIFSKNVRQELEQMQSEICRHTPILRLSPSIFQRIPLFLVPSFVFCFHVYAGPQFCSFCITAFPTLKKVRQVRVLTYPKVNWLPTKIGGIRNRIGLSAFVFSLFGDPFFSILSTTR